MRNYAGTVSSPLTAMTGYQKAEPPFAVGEVVVRPLHVKSGWGMDGRHQIAHRVDTAGVIWRDGKARMGARWVCPSGTHHLVPLDAPTQAPRSCTYCAAARPVVYLCWAGERVLYIGSTSNISLRTRSHSRRAWFTRVTHVETREFDSIEAARAEEWRLIYDLQPEVNVRGKAHLVGAA